MTTLAPIPRSSSPRASVVAGGGHGALDPSLATAEFLKGVPHDFARSHLILSQGAGADETGRATELLAIGPGTSPAAVHNVGTRLRRRPAAKEVDGESLARAIDVAYENGGAGGEAADRETAADDLDAELSALERTGEQDLLATQGKGPIVRLVDLLLFDALGRGASDVHVHPHGGRTLVRYRVDGVLHTVREAPPHATAAVLSRIKVMGRMDIAERRVPQDGRATVTIGREAGGRVIDLRISTLPTSYGERAVIRLLDNSNQFCDLDRLGMTSEIAGPYLDRAGRANGLILLTGPTGSGKTTTLYSTLRRIGSDALNIMTVEDPIEYDLSTADLAISQSQVNLKKGVTFVTGLRHILRQDPDVIMVGEIRDAETARIAVQASLTGHLVFSTLHTNDSPSAVMRLMDLGVEPYLVGASLSAVLAQRLIRTFHGACAGRGCAACLHTGFRGRMGVFELLLADDAVRSLIAGSGTLEAMREAAGAQGMRALADEGRRLAAAGVTSLEEVRRVVQGIH